MPRYDATQRLSLSSVLFALIFMFSSVTAYAQDSGSDAGSRSDSGLESERDAAIDEALDAREIERQSDLPDVIDESAAWGWLETRRDNLSKNVSGLGTYLDEWLAGESVGERRNESNVRLKINQSVSRFDGYEMNVRVSGKLDLPRATERWKLIFESDTTDLDSLREQRLDNTRSSEITGGFSYELPERNGWRFTQDIGIKGGLPLDPFYRIKTTYGRDLNADWSAGLDHKIWYYHTEGWGQDARIYFSREVRDNVFLRFDSEINYKDERNGFEFGQYISLHHSLGEMETLTYEFGVIGESQPTPRVDHYYVQSVYRKAIHEDWLVLEFVPQLIADREDDWSPKPVVQLNLEVFFFDF